MFYNDSERLMWTIREKKSCGNIIWQVGISSTIYLQETGGGTLRILEYDPKLAFLAQLLVAV